jgi:hypothetical protein
MADEKIPDTFDRREFREDGTQVILTELARSTAGGGKRRERRMRLDLPLHGRMLQD